jgi:hypothetical protein
VGLSTVLLVVNFQCYSTLQGSNCTNAAATKAMALGALNNGIIGVKMFPSNAFSITGGLFFNKMALP